MRPSLRSKRNSETGNNGRYDNQLSSSSSDQSRYEFHLVLDSQVNQIHIHFKLYIGRLQYTIYNILGSSIVSLIECSAHWFFPLRQSYLSMVEVQSPWKCRPRHYRRGDLEARQSGLSLGMRQEGTRRSKSKDSNTRQGTHRKRAERVIRSSNKES